MTHDCGETKRYEETHKDYFAGCRPDAVLCASLLQTKLLMVMIVIVHRRASNAVRNWRRTAKKLPPITRALAPIGAWNLGSTIRETMQLQPSMRTCIAASYG